MEAAGSRCPAGQVVRPVALLEALQGALVAGVAARCRAAARNTDLAAAEVAARS